MVLEGQEGEGEECRKRRGGDSRGREGGWRRPGLGLGEGQVQVKELEGLEVGGSRGSSRRGWRLRARSRATSRKSSGRKKSGSRLML